MMREAKTCLTVCPACGSSDTRQIAFGYPGPEMMGAEQRGEIVLDHGEEARQLAVGLSRVVMGVQAARWLG